LTEKEEFGVRFVVVRRLSLCPSPRNYYGQFAGEIPPAGGISPANRIWRFLKGARGKLFYTKKFPPQIPLFSQRR